MKLILITAITDYQEAIQEVLKKIGVKHYSFHDVNGYSQPVQEPLESNWFGTEIPTTDSVLYHIFLEDDQWNPLFSAIQSLNATLDTPSKVHAASFPIEQYI
ncbi:hypothetical protein [Flavobacterium sp.]|jgi:hypothetical protein|uniref:hypothetical protein n=1 Tax=Flavobacterium sp. TaxID=239 RepID=UPI0022BAF2AF|nr:hypothetical protein [Flavobacterium sp.]MCZ8145222.1 hypothetical protein [Flavobacterium sp.]MCZ8367158.1 hypothetical protein [Flavobacterium sp.]